MTINQSKKKEQDGVYKENEKEKEDGIYPEEKIEDGSNPDHRVKDEVNSEDDLLKDIQEEVLESDKEPDEAQYPDEAGLPTL